ncbi:MAG: DNA repair protein RecO [candidate division BRC1 bacterium ADurb.BinA364]|nr:MAG: DNA repair protein RecO [candidate division BRC1 bacterium ADurb.BinA364]
MALFQTEALVLGAVDFSESTQIARFVSPDRGKFSAMARGVKRIRSSLGPRLEAFSRVEVRVYAKEGAALGTLSAIDPIDEYAYLRADLERHALAATVLESIERGAAEGKPALELYRAATAYLGALGRAADAESLSAHTLLRLLCLLGFAPDLRPPRAESLSSRPEARLFFRPEEGRLSFAAPAEPRTPFMRLDAPLVEFLRRSMALRLEEFEINGAAPALRRPALDFLLRLLAYYLESELRSARFLRKMIWSAPAAFPIPAG